MNSESFAKTLHNSVTTRGKLASFRSLCGGRLTAADFSRRNVENFPVKKGPVFYQKFCTDLVKQTVTRCFTAGNSARIASKNPQNKSI